MPDPPVERKLSAPIRYWGETPCAFVTLKSEADASAEDVIAFCRTHLAHFKAPRTIISARCRKPQEAPPSLVSQRRSAFESDTGRSA